MILRSFLAALFITMVPSSGMAVSSAQNEPKLKCPAHAPPVINILPHRTDIVYDFTKSQAELTELASGAYNPYESHQHTVTKGLSSPKVSIGHKMVLTGDFVPEDLSKVCVFIHQIDLMIDIDPLVYVASEHPKGTCMHKAILKHELKHVRVNRQVTNEYAKKVGKALEAIVNARNGEYGPVPREKLETVQQNIYASFEKIMDQYNLAMIKERDRRQQNVDTLEEYASVGASCNK